jgi:hypothetical protein
LLALTLCLLVAMLWAGSASGPALADDDAPAEIRLAQAADADDGDAAAEDEGDAPAEGEGEAAAEDEPAAPAEGEGEAAAEEEADAQPAEGEGEAQAEEAVEEGPDPVVPVFDFEGDELAPNWAAFGQDAEAAIGKGFGEARAGQGALVLTYMPGDGNVPGVTVAPLEPAPGSQALEMAIKTTELSSIRFSVAEADGSEYENYLACPSGEWVDVAVAFDEMMLSDGSEDENGALDPEQIAGLTIMDLCNLPGEVGRALGMKQGMQHMWLDNVMLSDAQVAPRSSHQPDGTIVVDDFEGGPVLALPIGGAAMQFVAGPDGAGTDALEMTYRLGGHRWAGLVRGVSHLDLTGADTFVTNLRAEQRARLVAVLEERDGSKYETNIELDPEAGWTEVALPIEQFILDPTTDDENRLADLGQLRVIILVVDTFNASVDQTGHGSVLIDHVSFR